LRERLRAAQNLSQRFIHGRDRSVRLSELLQGSSLDGQRDALVGRKILLAPRDPVAAAVALIELDGLARCLVLCPPDVSAEQLNSIARTTAADALITDQEAQVARGEAWCVAGIDKAVTMHRDLEPCSVAPAAGQETEWILLTSGTSGIPKLVQHTFSSLAGAIRDVAVTEEPIVWGTFYDIRRYGGLQTLLRALLGTGSIVLPGAAESTRDFLSRAGAAAVTHINGTPSHWRGALMSGSAQQLAPRFLRLSGEIADQTLLDALRAAYPQARINQLFASTEAGVAFEVDDGRAGFPASLLNRADAPVQMKLEQGTLRIRSARTAARYLGAAVPPIRGSEDFVDTGDMVEVRGERCYFVGRKDGVINVGGLKVHPEEVEAAINAHGRVQMSAVRSKKNPITGAIVVAEVVLKDAGEIDAAAGAALREEILEACRRCLAPHKVPATIRFVGALALTASGKLVRSDA
jgi:acyl-coenzyme A synthetase/AMP-(fatty) acid ligase